MKVLSVASEVYPLIKTGGLADVAGALPAALAAHGVDMRVLLPGYKQVMAKLKRPVPVLEFTNLFGASATVLASKIDGVQFLVLDAPELYGRDGGPYTNAAGADHPDNWRRFAALCRAAATIAEGGLDGWIPDLVHAHDWQAGLVPVYMKQGSAAATPTVMTIHNIAFQGQFGPDIFPELDLPPAVFSVDGLEYYGDVSFLKGGLQMASAITTVSPTYAQEIRTPAFGMGLDGLINARADALHGIVNGIDPQVWDPATDPMIPANFSRSKLKKRQANRKALADRFGLAGTDGPVFTVVSRLTWQKGIDVLTELVDDIVGMGAKLVVLGSGDQALEAALLAATERHPGHVGLVIGYDEPLSHLMQAGGDMVLVPSRFEPCGLTQLYGLRYGNVPVVARTGGLADTIIDANEAASAARVATGFQFSPVTPDALREALRRAVRAFAEPKVWARLQNQGMEADVSWDRSALRYADLYAELLANKE
ncbi:glycogen/starch synthase, ADP-glucose type [Hoeflea sp. IMCC20628]|uniref:glycogen synthase GlgA n=1 Tax=Hoeflea sp. IMCC20628 TaxID=1620421 RepID=UPI00063A9672|nr:glycogen synthase GlgA [Hoeflea sp. IMCC20628]AKH99072.1 glycogen/starch synthase, ADP-glucose type [Hoeflea sp. IMCC20628]